MNQTTKVAVALIVAAGLSTMVYALPEQRAMAHPRLHLLSPESYPDDFPFGPNSTNPPLSASKSDPPPPGAGPPFGPNCVGCITTQNLANGTVTNPKLAAGSVLSANIGAGAVATPNIADQAITTPKIAPGAVSISTTEVQGTLTMIPPGTVAPATAQCPAGTMVTGGGFANPNQLTLVLSHRQDVPEQNGWVVSVLNPNDTPREVSALADCATIHP